MITNSYAIPTNYITLESGDLYVVKLQFLLDSISDLDGLKNHLNYSFSFEHSGYIYFCELIEAVDFEEVNGE